MSDEQKKGEFERYLDNPLTFETDVVASKHKAAIDLPTSDEAPLVGLVRFWLMYADQHRSELTENEDENGRLIRNQWVKIGCAIRILISKDSSRLHRKSLDSIVEHVLDNSGG